MLLLLFLLPVCQAAASAQNAALPPGAAACPLSLSCLPNLSQDTLPPRHGFLHTGPDGHFHWANGARARFWGINISSTRLEIPAEQIDKTAALFARSGLNLVRFEAIDNRNCLLGSPDAPDSQHFNAAYLHCLDLWIAALHKYHIGYYLDLLDLRTFRPGDGVPNANLLHRGARPCAMYDARLIQLQKEYAARLLTHRNPYTHLRLVDDPSLLMVEICNESGFFLRADTLSSLPSPYNYELQHLWCSWLAKRYKNRAGLKSAWGKLHGMYVLRPSERLSAYSVQMPLFNSAPRRFTRSLNDALHATTRLENGVRFLAHLQKKYFAEMKAWVRSLGLRVPVTAVVSSNIVPDVASVAQTCDFTAENWYGESLDIDPKTGLRYYDNNNPLQDSSAGGFAPYTAGLRWAHRPVVIREWDVTWPNPYRAESVPEVLAYASLQDYDAVMLFGYQTNTALNGAKADTLNDFAVQCDPTVWGLYALAGWVFMHHDISSANHTITLHYPGQRLYQWPNSAVSLWKAAWSVQISNAIHAAPSPYNIIPDSAHSQQQLVQLYRSLQNASARLHVRDIPAGIWRSDTGQITFDSHTGLLIVHTPQMAMITGTFSPDKTYRAGPVCFTTPTPFGALIAVALDGKPLQQSKHLVLKMVSLAANTGQVLQRAPAGALDSWVLTNPGTAPVITAGQVSGKPTSVWMLPQKPGGPVRSLLQIHLVNGSWELEIQQHNVTLSCDTPGAEGRALGSAFTGMAAAPFPAASLPYALTLPLPAVLQPHP